MEQCKVWTKKNQDLKNMPKSLVDIASYRLIWLYYFFMKMNCLSPNNTKPITIANIIKPMNTTMMITVMKTIMVNKKKIMAKKNQKMRLKTDLEFMKILSLAMTNLTYGATLMMTMERSMEWKGKKNDNIWLFIL